MTDPPSSSCTPNLGTDLGRHCPPAGSADEPPSSCPDSQSCLISQLHTQALWHRPCHRRGWTWL